jgi:hypothetical protein
MLMGNSRLRNAAGSYLATCVLICLSNSSVSYPPRLRRPTHRDMEKSRLGAIL